MHVLIVGVGAAGSMAAWRLSKAGHSVTALERFQIDHDLGSSFGESRIVRRVYPDPLYTGLMAEAFELWDELQDDWRAACPSGPNSDEAELIRRSGGLFFAERPDDNVESAAAALTANGVPFERLDGREVGRRFPEWRLAPESAALYEPGMGFARASHAVRAAVALARAAGAIVKDQTVVTRIESTLSGVAAITSAGERVSGDAAIITAGPWTADFLPEVARKLRTTRQAYIHLEASHPDGFESEQFPVWIDIGSNMYGFPRLGQTPGVKIASHNRGVALAPNEMDRGVSAKDKDVILQYAAEHLPGLTRNAVYEKVCIYTNTPEEDFIIDALPGADRCYIISACSGHGFKFAPLIGQIALELAVNGRCRHPLGRFGIDRLRN